MSPFHPQNSSTKRTLTTSGGVTVIVKATPEAPREAPREPQAPQAPERPPTVVVVPAPSAISEAISEASSGAPSDPAPSAAPSKPAELKLTKRERDALLRSLHDEHGPYLDRLLCARRDVVPASAQDLRQEVLLVLLKYIEGHGEPPERVHGYLAGVVRRLVSNHNQRWTPDVVSEADVYEAFSPEPDPHGLAEFAEEQQKFFRYLEGIPRDEAQVVLCRDFYHLSLEETAKAIDLPVGTVFSKHERAIARLREIAEESRRATEAGERRRPVPPDSSAPSEP